MKKRIILAAFLPLFCCVFVMPAFANEFLNTFLQIEVSMSYSEIKRVVIDNELEIGDVMDGRRAIKNEYIIKNGHFPVFSNSSMPTAMSEKESYVYIKRAEKDGDIVEITYFDLDSVMLYHYFADGINGLPGGYYIENLYDWEKMTHQEDGAGDYIPVSKSELSDITGRKPRDIDKEPIAELFCLAGNGLTEEKTMQTIDEYNLFVAFSGTVQKNGARYYSISYSKSAGKTNLWITFSPDGKVIDASYEDVFSKMITGDKGYYVSELMETYFGKLSRPAGYYHVQANRGNYYESCSSGREVLSYLTGNVE